MKLILLTFLILLSSCASYVAEMHKGFDKDDDKRRGKPASKDKFAMYRGNNSQTNTPNTRNQSRLSPTTRRDYQQDENIRKRYRADDFTHQGNNASLWGNDDSAQHLFTQSTEKKTGEIIIINVNSQLKKDITAELKRAFPDPPKLPKIASAADGKEGADAPITPAKPAPKPNEADSGGGTVHDRISSVIIEKINKNHLLLKGRKTILYKKRKRTVEVQALISKKQITGEDSVESDNILESNVRVVR